MAGEGDGASLELAFSKKKVDDRKTWLQSYVPGTFLDMTQAQISYSDFVNQACPDTAGLVGCLEGGLRTMRQGLQASDGAQ